MKTFHVWLNSPALSMLAIIIVSFMPLLRMFPQAYIHYQRTQQEQAR